MDIKDIKDMCNSLIELNKQRFAIVKYEVEYILENNIKDKRYIEHQLDELLEVLLISETEEALEIFKKLCRHYYKIDRDATIDYINFYLEDHRLDEEKTDRQDEEYER